MNIHDETEITLDGRKVTYRLTYGALEQLDEQCIARMGRSALECIKGGGQYMPAPVLTLALALGCADDYKKRHNKTLTPGRVRRAIAALDIADRVKLEQMILQSVFLARGVSVDVLEEMWSSATAEDSPPRPTSPAPGAPEAPSGDTPPTLPPSDGSPTA